jgi:hypothetical protein
MKLKLIALASAAMIGLTAVAIPNEAEANWRGGWWVPGAVIGGIALGAAIASRPYYYGPGRSKDLHRSSRDCTRSRNRPEVLTTAEVPTTADAAGGATAIECAVGGKDLIGSSWRTFGPWRPLPTPTKHFRIRV